MSDDLDLAVLTGVFDAQPGSEEALAAVLARYVVLTRHEPACRNVDLVRSATRPARFLVVEKWDSPNDVQHHLDSDLMGTMARDAVPLLVTRPEIDLYDSISAHDLA